MIDDYLPFQELTHRCQQEQAKFEAGLPNNPAFCFELLMRLPELPVYEALPITLEILYPYVARRIRYHPLLKALEENEISIASDIVINFFFQKIRTAEFLEKSTSFASILTLLNLFSHTQLAYKFRQEKRRLAVDIDELAQKTDPSGEIIDDFNQIFIQCLKMIYPNKESYQELAYLIFIAELKPREIEAQYPGRWTSIKQTVWRIRQRLRNQDFLECMDMGQNLL